LKRPGLKRVTRVLTAFVAGATLAGCGAGSGAGQPAATPAADIHPLHPDLLSGTVLGLRIAAEDVGGVLDEARRSFVDAAGLYGFRDEEGELQATLQVTRFNDEAEPELPAFRHGLVTKLGGSIPKVVRIGDDEVFVARRTAQLRAAWFHERWFFVLSANDRFEFPLALLRETLEIRP